jgi:hypothetical protein
MAKNFTCRLSDDEAEIIESMVEQSDFTRADVLRGALAFYINEDPDRHFV